MTLRPLFEADEEMKELGGPAYLAQLTGSGAAIIGARDFAEQIYDLALLRALVGVGREMVEQALDTSDEVDPKGQIEEAEAALYRVAEEGGGEGSGQELRGGDAAWPCRWPRRRSIPAAACPASPPASTSVNAKTGGLHHSDLIILAGRPGMGKTALATNIAFNAARALSAGHGGRHRAREIGRRRRSPSSASKCRPTSSPPASSPSSRGISSETLRMGKISQQDFRNLARAAGRARERCRSISTTRPASPSPRCAPAPGG